MKWVEKVDYQKKWKLEVTSEGISTTWGIRFLREKKIYQNIMHIFGFFKTKDVLRAYQNK